MRAVTSSRAQRASVTRSSAASRVRRSREDAFERCRPQRRGDAPSAGGAYSALRIPGAPAMVAALSPRRGSVQHAATWHNERFAPRTAGGALTCRRSASSSSRAASSSMPLRAGAVTCARTKTYSPFRARLATSAPFAMPNGSRCGRSGCRRCSSRLCRTGK